MIQSLFFGYVACMVLLVGVHTVRAAVAASRLAKHRREHDARFLATFGSDRATMRRVYGGLLK